MPRDAEEAEDTDEDERAGKGMDVGGATTELIAIVVLAGVERVADAVELFSTAADDDDD
jgi:hypothetical protein